MRAGEFNLCRLSNKKVKDKLLVTQKLSEKTTPGIQGLFTLKDRMIETCTQPLEPDKNQIRLQEHVLIVMVINYCSKTSKEVVSSPPLAICHIKGRCFSGEGDFSKQIRSSVQV